MPAKKQSKSSRASSPKISAPSVASFAIVVSDRNAAKRWYTEKLGLKVDADGEHWVTVGKPRSGAVIHLCEYPEAGKVELEPGNTGILLIVDGKLATYRAAWTAKGVEVAPIEEHPWGDDMVVKDPDGNELLVMEG